MKVKKKLEKWIARFLAVVMIITCVPVFNHSKARAGEKNIETNQISSQDTVTSVLATNSFGKLLQKPMRNQAEKHEENNGYNVFSVEMSGKTAAVSMETVEDCILVVGIYEEDGIKMLATGNKKVTKEEREVTLDIEIDTMPQYYLVRAFLIEDDTMNPLCSVYETPMYTKEMQDFLSKTTDDFEEKRVLNLDEDKTNNFAVYGEDTKIIKGSDDNNCLKCTNEEKQNYVIEKADASAISLSKGDIFAYERENQEVVIVKVSSISVEGSTVTINGEDTDLEDVFEYVKIDETATTADMEVDASECSEGVEYQGKENNSAGQKKAISGEGSTSVSLSYKFTKDKLPSGKDNPLSGSVKLAIKTSLKVYISWQYQYLEFTSKYSLANDWKLELKTEDTIKLGEVVINPVPGLYIRLKPSFLVKAAGSVRVTGTIDGCIGYSASPQDGFKDLTSAPSLDREKTELKIEGTIFIGFSLEPSITVVTKKLVKASAKAKAGLELKIANSFLDTLDDSKEKHDCTNWTCFEGEIHAKGEISAELKFFDNESFRVSGKKGGEFKISDVYYCLEHGKFAFSACPYHQYKVTVIAKNPDGTLVKEATVNQDFQTNSKGEAYLWFARGKHKLSVSKNGKDVITKVVDVAGKARKITVTFKTNSVVDDETGDSGDNGDIGDIGDGGDIELEGNPLAGKKIIQIEKGENHYGAITENKDLYLWGNNYYHQIGAEYDSTDPGRYTPVKVLSDVMEIKLDSYSSLALTNKGDLYDSSQGWSKAILNDVVEFKVDRNGVALTKYGELYLLQGAVPVKTLTNVKDFGVHNSIFFAITKDDVLYLWGYNEYGQIGDGTTVNKTTPVKVLANVKQFNCDGMTTGAITNDGSLYMWGDNNHGQIGDGTTVNKTTPTKVLTNVKQFNCDDLTTGAITNDGSLYMWGDNNHGQIGDGTTINKTTPTKVLTNVKQFDCNGLWSGAITNDGILYTWGGNECGQIGDGTTEDKTIPTKVLADVKQFDCNFRLLSVALTEDDSLYMWGNNEYGQIGNGTRESQKTPYNVMEDIEKVLCGYDDVIAMSKNGNIYMWGGSLYYPINFGKYELKTIPTQINAPLPTTKASSNSKKEFAANPTISPQIYTWTGHATGWGGPDSYPSSANHEQGTTEITYNSSHTNIKSSVGYGCGLELMNPDNSFFNGEENELSQILNTMKKPCIRVTLENDGMAHGWNQNEQLEFPSGKNVLFPKGYFDTQYFAIFGDDDIVTSVQIYDASLLTLSSNGSILPVQSFENLDANVTYNYYLLKSKDTENTLSSNNLLYIGQGVSDSSGILYTSYEMKEDFAEPIILLHKIEKDSVTDAKITLSDLSYNRQEQYISPTVTYHGKSLVEGRDYELSGDFSASEIGTYTVTICGIGNYIGFVDKTYNINCSHQFGNWKTTTRPTFNSNGTKRRICSLCGYEEKKSVPQLQDTHKQAEINVPITTPKKPGKVAGLKVKNKKKRKVIVSWNWKSSVSGFQIQYAQNRKFTKKKKAKIVGRWTSQKAITRLKKNKTYYIRVRAYRQSSEKKIYGKWSKVKKVKIRK